MRMDEKYEKQIDEQSRWLVGFIVVCWLLVVKYSRMLPWKYVILVYTNSILYYGSSSMLLYQPTIVDCY